MPTMKDALEHAAAADIRHIVSVSGGKDSAALAIYMRQRYPDLPVEYVFCDTHNELPETDDFIARLEAVLGRQVTRVSALDVLNIRAKKGRNAFEIYLNELYGGFLPNPRSRWCTRVLKIEPFERYVGSGSAYSYIGIRADEDRDGYQTGKKPPVFSQKPNIMPVYPFRDDGIDLQGVKRILEDSGLGLPSYYDWRSRSGCYFCFYQQIGEWQGLKREHPDLFEKAKSFEKTVGDKQFTWCQGRNLEEIASLPERDHMPADEADGCAICHL
ncbi:MAG: phosphoadenosine phosphosulfate reductase family protein [Planctomycetes bacterium]|nr:phosphoadenosine phosphosulfate reductase family protein [Planctomycetota bacterium]